MTDSVPESIESYWFSFESTGNEKIDAILGAVAHAGRMYHSTDSWADKDEDDGTSLIDLIQEAANEAADLCSPKWISCEDELPDNGRTVLVIGGIAYYDYNLKDWYSLTGIEWPGREITWDVDCWADLPLPSPPEAGE